MEQLQDQINSLDSLINAYEDCLMELNMAFDEEEKKKGIIVNWKPFYPYFHELSDIDNTIALKGKQISIIVDELEPLLDSLPSEKDTITRQVAQLFFKFSIMNNTVKTLLATEKLFKPSLN